jgi:hypothetical protein
MRKTGRDIRVKAVFMAKNTKTPKTAYSTKPKKR